MQAERNELGGRVRSAVDGLEPELRTAVRLRYEHGMTYEEIAEATDAPGGTVAWRLSEAHRRLQRVLAATGVVLAIAALERELEAAPAPSIPERLSRAVRQIAQGGPGSGSTTGAGTPRPWRMAGALGVAAVLAIAVFLGLRDRAEDPDPPAIAAGAPGGAAGNARGSSGADPVGPSGTARQPADPTRRQPGLVGRIYDRASGAPVPNAELTLRNGTVLHPGPIGATGTGNADGTYEISCPPGPWMLNVSAPGYVDFAMERYAEWSSAALSTVSEEVSEEELDTLFGSRVEVPDFSLASFDVPLVATAVLSGQVLDEAGMPLPGAGVTVTGQSIQLAHGTFGIRTRLNGSPASAVTDSQGRFRFDSLYPAGKAAVKATRSGYRDGTALVEIGPGLHETSIRLKVRPPTVLIDLTAVVLGPLGPTLDGAVVLAGGQPDENGHRTLKLLPAGEDGEIRTQLPDDTGWIVAWAPGHGIAVRSFADRGAGRLELRPPAADRVLRGCVLDADGTPVPGARVQISHLEVPVGGTWVSLAFTTSTTGGGMASLDPTEISAFMPDASRAPSAFTAADGSFTLEGVFLPEGGRVRLLAASDGHDLGYAIANGPEWIEFRLER